MRALRFHQPTCDLLGIEPRQSASAVRELDELERRRRICLPASVREWYSQEDAVEMLRRFSNNDPPIPIEELGDERRDTHGGGPHDLIVHGLLPFRYENQAVCVWAVRLDGSEDPPVVVDVDSQFKKWRNCCERFSTHVYSSVWDYAVALGRDLLVRAIADPIDERTIHSISNAVESQQRTYGWPGDTQYRFQHRDRSILIWAIEEQSDWFVSAATIESLQDVLARVWKVGSFAEVAWSESQEGKELLRRMSAA